MQKMDKAALTARVCEIIRERNAEIVELGHAIFAAPELGFKEVKTAEKVKQAFEKLGIAYETGWGITGVKARMKGKASKRTVALLGELDAIVCRTHPNCDPVTGAAHCCGHNVQIANVIAVAQALKEAGAMDYLGGDVVLFAVPAEEYVASFATRASSASSAASSRSLLKAASTTATSPCRCTWPSPTIPRAT